MSLKNFRKEEKGVVTIEASLILVIFISAYIALLSFFGIYKTYVIVQNALNQSAKELAQYSYIAKVMHLEDTGKETKKRAEAFKEDSKKTIDTVSVFIKATDKGIKDSINSGKELAKDINETGKSLAEDVKGFSEELESDAGKVKERLEDKKDLELEEIVKAAEALDERLREAEELKGKIESSVDDISNTVDSSLAEIEKNKAEIEKAYLDMEEKMTKYHSKYLSDTKSIINVFANFAKDAVYDGIKTAGTYPIAKVLMDKYLQIYSNEDFKNLGIVNGKDGINYWGSNMFIRDYDICLVANYRYKLELPFLDKFEISMRNTAITRAWIGDKENKKEEE